MARPKKTQEGPSAVERMEEAFWELLDEKPYSKITVGEIVKRAQVNRNAFYYHFDNLDDLADYALDNALPYELYSQFFHSPHADFLSIESFVQNEDLMDRISKMSRVAGKHGTGELLAKAQKMAITAVLEENNLTEEDLTKEELLELKFVTGGTAAVASADLGGEHPLPILLRTRIAPSIYESLFSTLREAEERKKRRL